MKILNKLIIFFVLILKSVPNCLGTDLETKVKQENGKPTFIKEEVIKKIKAYRSKELEKYMPKVLGDLVLEYNVDCNHENCEQFQFDSEDEIASLYYLSEDVFAIGYVDKINIWNYKTNKITREFKLSGFRHQLCPLPNKQFAYAENGSKKIKIFNWQTGECVRTLQGYSLDKYGEVTSLCLISDVHLASGHRYGKVKVWNLKTGNFEKSIMRNNNNYYCGFLCCLPNKKLVAGFNDGYMMIYDLEIDDYEKSFRNENHCNINALCFLEKNKFVSGDNSGVIKVWDLENYECIKTIISNERFCRPIKKIIPLSTNRFLIEFCFDVPKVLNIDTGQYEKIILDSSYDLEVFFAAKDSFSNLICILPDNSLAFITELKVITIFKELVIPNEKLMTLIDDYKQALKNYKADDKASSAETEKCIIELLRSINFLLYEFDSERQRDNLSAKKLLFNREVDLKELKKLAVFLQIKIKEIREQMIVISK